KMCLTRLLGERDFGSDLTLVLGDERPVGARHVERREKSPVGSQQFEDIGGKPIDARAVKNARERACLLLGGEDGAPQQTRQDGALCERGLKTTETTLDAMVPFCSARGAKKGGAVGARHARDDCLFACHVDLFRQFRGIGTAVDGGREALEIQWNSAFPRKNAGALTKPTRSHGCVTYRQLRCNMTTGQHQDGW